MSQVQWGDIATWVSGIGTTVAVGFAAVQVAALRRQEREERAIELDGVSVHWKSEHNTSAPHEQAAATTSYTFTVTNPGRLPISDVDVRVSFRIPVQCVRRDGTLLAASNELVLDTPVVRGGGERVWERTLRLASEDTEELRYLRAIVTFTSPRDGVRHKNEWGRRHSV